MPFHSAIFYTAHFPLHNVIDSKWGFHLDLYIKNISNTLSTSRVGAASPSRTASGLSWSFPTSKKLQTSQPSAPPIILVNAENVTPTEYRLFTASGYCPRQAMKEVRWTDWNMYFILLHLLRLDERTYVLMALRPPDKLKYKLVM